MSQEQKTVFGENYAKMDVKFNNHNLHIKDHGGYESRHKSMVNLIRDAWYSKVKNDRPAEPFKFFTLHTDDHFNPHVHFSFAAFDSETSVRSMPHFIFDQWPECGIREYQEVFDGVVRASEVPYESNKAFWVGVVFDSALYPHCSRHKGCNVARKLPDMMDFRGIEWKMKGPEQFRHTPGYVTLPGHCAHRVLIDFGGIGFSARLPLLLASGRPVIIVGRPYEAWFYWDGSLSPWEHYIPCGDKSGWSVSEEDIEKAVRWTFDNIKESKAIGLRGQKYALENLTRRAAVERIGSMMNSFCRSMWSESETAIFS